jgi:molybdopterin converting factor small subunit
MTVRVKLFAIAKELTGRDVLDVEVKEGATLIDVRKAIEVAFPMLRRVLPHAVWAVDAEYARDDTLILAQSDLALIPPVSGG